MNQDDHIKEASSIEFGSAPSQANFLVAARLNWAFDPDGFSQTDTALSWTRSAESRLNFKFHMPALKSAPHSIKFSFTPMIATLSIKALILQDRRGKHIASWNPTTATARKSPYSPTIGATACGQLSNLELSEFCLRVELPEGFARKLTGGGELIIECEFSDSLPGVGNTAVGSSAPNSFLGTASDVTPRGQMMRRLVELENEVQALTHTVRRFYDSNTWKSTRALREIAKNMRNSVLVRRFVEKESPVKLRKTCQFAKVPRSMKVDVIVPVYRGYEETLACIDSVLSSSSEIDFDLIIIDDASPEPELINELQNLAGKHKKITLLHNEKNVGFTATVVRGMALHSDRDVVLLNSDTVVCGDWLERLTRQAYSHERIGSVTPFSNNASICGYPVFLGEEELPEGVSTEQIDQIAGKVNAGMSVEIPTGVGCCMYITRRCLNDVGEFDAKTFPGYGEENDFCMRATLKNWKHLMAADVFVYHKGAVSFASQSEIRKAIAMRRLQHLYPQYDSMVSSFISLDPATILRHRIDLERLRRSKKPVFLAIMHDGTGGTERHVLDLMKASAADAHWFLFKGCHAGGRLEWRDDGEGLKVEYDWKRDFQKLVKFLKEIGLERIHIHHTHQFTKQARQLVETLGVPFEFTIHDYSVVCPQVTLTDYSGAYCGEPDENGCNKCLAFMPTEGAPSIERWRDHHSWLITKAARVLAPSQDAAERMQRYFPAIGIMATPPIDSHLESPREVRVARLNGGEKLRIAVIGALTEAKGADLLELTALDARVRNLPLEFHLIGHAYRPLRTRPKASLTVYGQYQPEDLIEMIEQIRPHIAWFPAQCPETYCYALSACMEAGLPVVAPDLGAFRERLNGRPYSWVVPWNQEASEWNEFFCLIAATPCENWMWPDLTQAPGDRPAAVDECQALAGAARSLS